MTTTKAAQPAEQRASLWTAGYVITCLAQFLAYSNGVMLNPVLPVYLTELGQGPAVVGLTVAAFSVASFGTRPWIGGAVDQWSGRGVYALSSLVMAVASFGYALPSVIAVLVGRIVHGTGWAGINTAGAALVAEYSPAHRRGEAVGFFAMMRGLASTLGPAAGLWIVGLAGSGWAFAASGVIGLLAVATTLALRGTARPRPAPLPGGVTRNLIDRDVLLPTLLHLLQSVSYPITTMFIVLYARHRGIEDVTFYYLALGAAQITVQVFGRVSDRVGRAVIIAAGFTSDIAGMLVLLTAGSTAQLVLGGVLCGAGVALVSSATMALAFDLMKPERRGGAMATYTAAFQVAGGASGLVYGLLIQYLGFESMFVADIAILLVGVGVLATNWRTAAGGRLTASRG